MIRGLRCPLPGGNSRTTAGSSRSSFLKSARRSIRKTIYRLPDLRDLMRAANARYLDFLAAIDDPHVGPRQLEKIAEPVREDDRQPSWPEPLPWPRP